MGSSNRACPASVAWLIALAVYGLQMGHYVKDFYAGQKQISNGGSNLYSRYVTYDHGARMR